MNWPGRRRLPRARCGWRCSNSSWRGASNIRATASPCGRSPTKRQPARSSIERRAAVMQSGRGLVGLLVRAFGLGDGVGADKYFTLRLGHPEEISQELKAAGDRHGLELGGHVGDVARDI